MSIRIVSSDLHILNMRTRLPFRYGIATMTAVPHLFVRVVIEFGGQVQAGIAADGLPPKWFVKDPARDFAGEVADMLAVTRAAGKHAVAIGETANLFAWWRELDRRQREWAAGAGHPPLLAQFGGSLIERAAIDAFCRITEDSFSSNLRWNTLGIDLGAMHDELAGDEVLDLLPVRPLETVTVRHTVGLGDALTDADIPPSERVNDGLPQSLEAAVKAYGLRQFKVKLTGDTAADCDRLGSVFALLDHGAPADWQLSLDGNEQFADLDAFRGFWERLHGTPVAAALPRRLLFVEQPLPRDRSFAPALAQWLDRPPIIIDEADATAEALPRALECGYAGASHKNCKGVFKGIANACLLARRREDDPEGSYLQTGEDLANVGPVALLQDLCVMANLGIASVERNGHHYFRGLSMLPEALRQRILDRHPRLYRQHDAGFPTLRIEDGRIDLSRMVNDTAKPFGVGFLLDPAEFTPADQWRPDSLDAC